MKKYEKPIVMINEELAEGVYAASGYWTVTIKENHQTREIGQDSFVFQMDGVHSSTCPHTGSVLITCVFSEPVIVTSKPQDWSYVDISSTTVYSYAHSFTRTNLATNVNPTEEIGSGDFYVKPADDNITELTLTDAWIEDGGPK